MNKCEITGAHELLSMLADPELMSVKDTVTKSMMPANTRSEAIDACLKCSQSAMQLLRRKKIRRDILMQYLARKSIPVVAGTDKVRLVKQIIDFWNNGSQPTTTSLSPSLPLPNISQLSHQFTEWFFTSWNGLTTFSYHHFFPDCSLCLVHENQRRVFGAQNVYDVLRSYVNSQELRFSPNIQSNRAFESKHGLVLIQVYGTIHQRGSCIGIFEQSFGLVRDPTHSNNYLVKLCLLDMRTSQQQQQLFPADHSQQSPPTYIVEIMENYDQSLQQQQLIDASDYIIDEDDDESD